MITNSDVVKVLNDDGIKNIDWNTMRKYENITTISLNEIRKELGMGSWAIRLAFSPSPLSNCTPRKSLR